MRRPVLLALAGAAATALCAPSAQASVTCAPVGPVPGYGPVCTVTCVLSAEPEIDPRGTQPVTGVFQPCWYQD